MAAPPEFVAIGKIVKPHGVKGEALVFALTDHLERFAEGERLWLSPTPEGDRRRIEVEIEASRAHKGRRLLKLGRFVDRAMVEQRVGWYLVIPFEDADAAREPDEFFLHALPGREVVAEDGAALGEVVDVMLGDGPPLLEIAMESGRRYLPFVREFVLEVTEERLTVRPPDGWEEL